MGFIHQSACPCKGQSPQQAAPTFRKKTYLVRFYAGSVTGDRKEVTALPRLLGEELERQRAGEPIRKLTDGALQYELRDLETPDSGASFRGVLAVLRDEAPHIRGADGAERPIDLRENEHVIEKNHFVLFSETGLLVWQVNGRASHVSRLERVLMMLSANRLAVVFDDVLDRRALEQLSSGMVRRLKLRLAAPRNPAALDPQDWTSCAFSLLSGAGATELSLEISTRRHSRGLSDDFKKVIHRLLDTGEVKTLGVVMDRDKRLVDLLADCVTERIEVAMDGLYPVAADMFAALEAARQRKQPQLDDFFGAGDGALE